MPLSMTKVPSIKPGQIYECTQKHHKGWLVEVVRVSTNHLEARGVAGNQAARSKAHSKNGNYNYLRTQFERDYILIKDVDEMPIESQQQELASLLEQPVQPILEQPNTRLCPECYQFKSTADYVHPRKGWFKQCKSCRTAKAKATRAAKTKQPKQPKPPKQPTSEVLSPNLIAKGFNPIEQAIPYKVAGSTSGVAARDLATQLVELASKVEQLSYPVSLLEAVRDLLLEATDAHGVVILPAQSLDTLQKEFNAVKNQIDWSQPQPSNGAVQ